MNPSTISVNQLKETIILVIKKVKPEYQLTDMQGAILEEMCEHVLNSRTVDHSDAREMVMVSLNSFETSYHLIRSMIIGVIDSYGSIKINFRGRDFSFDKSTNLI